MSPGVLLFHEKTRVFFRTIVKIRRSCCEAIAANHMGMKICGISCIANPAAGISKKPLTHEEVQQSADRAAPKFQKLVTECICRMGKSLKK